MQIGKQESYSLYSSLREIKETLLHKKSLDFKSVGNKRLSNVRKYKMIYNFGIRFLFIQKVLLFV